MKRSLFFIFATIYVLVVVASFSFISMQYKQQLQEAKGEFDNLRSIRAINKSYAFIQQSYAHYALFLQDKDEETLYQSLDSLDMALGFFGVYGNVDYPCTDVVVAELDIVANLLYDGSKTAALDSTQERFAQLMDDAKKCIMKAEVDVWRGISLGFEETSVKLEQNFKIMTLQVFLLIGALLFMIYLYFDRIRIGKKVFENEKRLELISNNISEVFWLIDDKTQEVLYINKAYEKLWGRSCESLYCDSQSFMDTIYDEDKQMVDDAFKNYQQNGKFDLDYRIVRADGTIVWIHAKSFIVHGKNAEIVAHAGVASDITEHKQQQVQIENLNKNLEQKVQEQTKELREQFEQLKKKDEMLQEQAKLAAMGEMMSAIAHQWRQPLNALSINIQNLEDDFEDGLIDAEFIDEFIQKQIKTIHFMSKTIDDFRNFFKTDKKKTHFYIQDVVENVYKLLYAQLKNYNIEFVIEGEDFELEGYQSEMQQVILNLISNSKDAINKNGTSGIIRVQLDSKNKSVIFCDSGGGVPKEILEKIFEPYFTTKSPDKGTGIGLYISRTIVVSHMGGTIKVYNADEGFCIEMNFQKDKA